MNKFMIRGTFSVDAKRAFFDRDTGIQTSRPLASIDLGVAFSISDNLEVGVSNYRVGAPPRTPRKESSRSWCRPSEASATCRSSFATASCEKTTSRWPRTSFCSFRHERILRPRSGFQCAFALAPL